MPNGINNKPITINVPITQFGVNIGCHCLYMCVYMLVYIWNVYYVFIRMCILTAFNLCCLKALFDGLFFLAVSMIFFFFLILRWCLIKKKVEFVVVVNVSYIYISVTLFLMLMV